MFPLTEKEASESHRIKGKSAWGKRLPRASVGGVRTVRGFLTVTSWSAPIMVSNSSELFGFLCQITSGVLHLAHRLLCRAFGITSQVWNASSQVLGRPPDLFWLWENATHLLKACLQEAPRLFWPQKNDQTGPYSDDCHEESCDPPVHVSLSFLRWRSRDDLSFHSRDCTPVSEDMSLLLPLARSTQPLRFKHASRHRYPALSRTTQSDLPVVIEKKNVDLLCEPHFFSSSCFSRFWIFPAMPLALSDYLFESKMPEFSQNVLLVKLGRITALFAGYRIFTG